MAVTISRYNHTLKKLLNNEVNYADLKLMLLDADAAFDAADVAIGDVNADQVSGNGWAVGGVALANAAVTVVTTNDAKIDADDIDITAAGGPIGPARSAVIYEVASGDLLFNIDFGEDKTADDTTHFKVLFHASGIVLAQ